MGRDEIHFGQGMVDALMMPTFVLARLKHRGADSDDASSADLALPLFMSSFDRT